MGQKDFREIRSRASKVIELAKETVDKEMLEFGRILLQVEGYCCINSVINVHIFGNLVTVREDARVKRVEEIGEGEKC